MAKAFPQNLALPTLLQIARKLLRMGNELRALLLPAKFNWKIGIKKETQFWDDWFRTKGATKGTAKEATGPARYRDRLNPDFPLQARPEALLPVGDVHILDVGAGPLTYLGKKAVGRSLTITAIDALAHEYDKILNKYSIQPLVRTQKLDAENLTARYGPNTFDLCFARNCLDHTYDPERAILQMIQVVKKGRYVLLEHYPNEAENQHYSGLHQWNFDVSPDGDFLIYSKSTVTNFSKKYGDLAVISCEYIGQNLLVTRILKPA